MGPLNGFRIVELAGIGPGPFCGMMLSDMGAEVICVDRIDSNSSVLRDVLQRNRRSIAIDLKNPLGVELVLKLVDSADAFFEGFRPGVAERLGLGPEVCIDRNPKLVYGRVTGWGQTGPLAQSAGHDINYIALCGALHAIGERGRKPIPPLNLVGDFGGGGMLLAFGLVCALLEAQKSGQGQVVDAAMLDGAATLMAMYFAMTKHGFTAERGANLLDGGAHFYGTYETKDGEYIAIGAIEPQFYRLFINLTGADGHRFSAQMKRNRWPELREELEEIFKTKTQAEWCEIMEGTDVCFAPVLSIWDAPGHPHNIARSLFPELDSVVQPAPSPRFSRTAPQISHPAPTLGADTNSVLTDMGFSQREIDALSNSGILGN